MDAKQPLDYTTTGMAFSAPANSVVYQNSDMAVIDKRGIPGASSQKKGKGQLMTSMAAGMPYMGGLSHLSGAGMTPGFVPPGGVYAGSNFPQYNIPGGTPGQPFNPAYRPGANNFAQLGTGVGAGFQGVPQTPNTKNVAGFPTVGQQMPWAQNVTGTPYNNYGIQGASGYPARFTPEPYTYGPGQYNIPSVNPPGFSKVGQNYTPFASPIGAFSYSSPFKKPRGTPENYIATENAQAYPQIISGVPTPSDWGAHASETMDFLRNMWRDSKMCDVVLQVCGVSLPAHRVAIAAHSDRYAHHFKTLQNTALVEIILSKTTPEAAKNVLSYIYSGIIEVNDNIIDAIVGCAKELGITKIENLCKDYLFTVSIHKAFFYLEIAEKHDLLDAMAAIRRFIRQHFKEISHTPNFVYVESDRLHRLLADDTLVVGSELDVFFAIIRWIDFDRNTRMCHAADLLRMVRFNHVSPEEIVTHVEPINYIFQLPDCKEILYAAFRYHALKSIGSMLAQCSPQQYTRFVYNNPNILGPTITPRGPISGEHQQLMNQLSATNPELASIILAAPELAALMVKSPDLARQISVNPDVARLMTDNPNLARQITAIPDLARVIAGLPDLARLMVTDLSAARAICYNPTLASIMAQNPDFARVLASNPVLINTIAINQDLLKTMSQNPKVIQLVTTNALFAKNLACGGNLIHLLCCHPDIVDLLLSNPDFLTVIMNNPDFCNTLACYGDLTRCVLTNSDLVGQICASNDLVRRLIANPGLVNTMFPGLTDGSTKNKSFRRTMSFDSAVVTHDQPPRHFTPKPARIPEPNYILPATSPMYPSPVVVRDFDARVNKATDDTDPSRTIMLPSPVLSPCIRNRLITSTPIAQPINESMPETRMSAQTKSVRLNSCNSRTPNIQLAEKQTEAVNTHVVNLASQSCNKDNVSTVIMTMGSVDNVNTEEDSSSRNVHEYNPQSNNWSTVTQIPDFRHHHGTAALDGNLYVIGGSLISAEKDSTIKIPTDSCYRFNILKCQWSQISSMNHKRVFHAVAEVFGLIYSVGGEDGCGNILDSVECYNAVDDTWHEVKPMSEPKLGAASVGHKGTLFVIGGFTKVHERKMACSTVESYELPLDKWDKRINLPIPLCHASAVVIKNTMYLIGGATFNETMLSITSLSTVYKYEDVSQIWSRFQDMSIPRHDFSAAALGNLIYILGGMSSVTGSVLSAVECLDTITATWIKGIEDLPYPVIGSAACTVFGNTKKY